MVLTLETLPAEVRVMILELCLCVKGDIVPFPTWFESVGRVLYPGTWSQEPGWEEATEFPCVLLLRVSKAIRAEALPILFSKNVWRLSLNDFQSSKAHDTKANDFWERNLSLFKHVTTKFRMGAIILRTGIRGDYLDDTVSFQERTWYWKRRVLSRMSPKTLKFGFEHFPCCMGRCRNDMFNSFCAAMGQTGPWYRKHLEPIIDKGRASDVATKGKTQVILTGLRDKEREFLETQWGLERNS